MGEPTKRPLGQCASRGGATIFGFGEYTSANLASIPCHTTEHGDSQDGNLHRLPVGLGHVRAPRQYGRRHTNAVPTRERGGGDSLGATPSPCPPDARHPPRARLPGLCGPAQLRLLEGTGTAR
eukprot:6897432-Pyramimonas_sp.AAC.1